jgi:sensor domain CHASE-containing protein
MIIDRAGEVLLARDTDLRSELPLDLDLTALRSLPEEFPWREQLRAGRPARGLLQTSRGILILAESPVLDGTGGGPARGMVLMGRLLTPEVIKVIAAQAQADLTLLPPAASAQPETIEETEQLTRVYRTFQDVYGKPLMTLRVDVPREVSLRGKAAVKIAALSLFTAVVVVLILLVVVLNRVILDPLAAITRHAVTIGEGKGTHHDTGSEAQR